MKPASRWPLHPAPVEGEALSSWLHRIAGCYRMEVRDLLEHDLGHDQAVDLDEAPPLSLLRAISQRSGIGLDRLRSMSFAGWVPWLLDGLDPCLCAKNWVSRDRHYIDIFRQQESCGLMERNFSISPELSP